MSNKNQELEGFICPICYVDLGSLLNLRGHFETCHPDEDTAIVDQIKGLFGKAKKFLGKDGSNTPVLTTTTSFTHTLPSYSEHQELGVIHSHTDVYKQIRDRRVDRFSMQTNNLLNRIDKLLKIDQSLDDNKKKELEKSLVAWASDSDTTICMTCGHRFNLTRRRHHCRLCGCVICSSCSCFLSRHYARKLATTTTSSSFAGPTFNPSNEGEDSSVPSMRCCRHCRFLLERREEQIKSKTLKPSLVVLYENIKGLMEDADSLVPEYSRIVASLSKGENNRHSEAAVMKSSINEISQRITHLLKKLSEEEESKLRNVLTQWASWYVQEKLLSSPRLPSEEEVEKVKMLRKKMAEERIANERKLEEIWREKYEEKIDNNVNSYNTSGAASGASNSVGSAGSSNPFIADIEAQKGWLPDKRPKTSNPFDDGYEEDPLLQQIQNIQRYIKQAERDRKYDEMRMLEENLKLLQLEYQKQL